MTFSIANASQKASQSASRRFGGLGRVGMLVLLLSVFFQSYVAQTHIHDAGRLFAQVTAATASAAGPDVPAPGDEDNANCLLCQAALHAGSFAAPAILAILLPAMLFLGLAEALPSRPARILLASHGWRSRAPPLS